MAKTLKTTADISTLQDLLNKKGIIKVYYVDDENDLKIDVELVKSVVKIAYNSDKRMDLDSLGLGNLDPSDPLDIIFSEIDTTWGSINAETQVNIFQSLKTITAVDNVIELDTVNAKRILTYFTEGIIEALSPHEWDKKKREILESIQNNEVILVLFDEELKFAGGKFLTTRGQDLMAELIANSKKHNLSKNVICTLLTHTIRDAQGELPARDRIRKQRVQKDLSAKDFFPLAKARISHPAEFADGIKKAIINPYVEELKTKTINLINKSYKIANNKIKLLDTYDFENTIIDRSFAEGVWEPETIIRIADIIFESSLKELMVETKYAKHVNKSIREAQKYSEFRYAVNTDFAPYSEKLKWRHNELYENGQTINLLNQPVGNGDIFTIGDKKFILVAQPCDLMIRGGNALGTRKAKVATLLLINEMKKEELEKQLKSTNYSNFNFSLEYFKTDGNDCGVASFKDYIIVDIDYLDLCAFNSEGKSEINIKKSKIITPLLSKAWEARYSVILEKLKSHHKDTTSIKRQLNSIDAAVTEQVLFKYLPRFLLASTMDVENLAIYDSGLFAFNVKRIMSLKEPKASHLLNRFTKHQSRVAEPHDFAR